MPGSRGRPTIVDEIYAHLRDRILGGELADGEQLRQLEIADSMGCSQGPVRHALDRLSNDELVLLLPNRGYFVAQISLDHARQAYELRSLIEPFAARAALQHMTKERLHQFDAVFARMKIANRRADFKASLGADMDFHRLFYEQSGFPLLLRFWELMEAQIRKFVTVTTPLYVAELARVTDLHSPILDAMKRDDSDALARSVRDHVQHVWTLIGTGGPDSLTDDSQPGLLSTPALEAVAHVPATSPSVVSRNSSASRSER